MTKWKTIAGKFTPDEIEVIKPFQKSLGVNDNQFVRASILVMLFHVGSFIKLAESNVEKDMDIEYRKIKKEIAKYPELNAKIQPFLKKMMGSYTQTTEQIVKENEPEMEKFTKRQKVGRPKSLKKNPGRPKDTESRF